MKIAFICGCLEPGGDGVGDYSRRLAGQLASQGHECLLLSLRDRERLRKTEGDYLVARYNDALINEECGREALHLLNDFDPDWISLQFVCFAFHPKGLIHRLIPWMARARKNRRLHLMLHELWLGEQPSLPLRHKLLGRIQRRQILRALRSWQSSCHHTSNRLYQSILERENTPAGLLPIFGNIPVSTSSGKAGPVRPPDQRELIFPFSQRNDWNAMETMGCLRKVAKRAGVSLKLVQVGRLRSDAKHWDAVEAFAHDQGWDCERLGSQFVETLSYRMQSADIGVCAVHPLLADKSGAAVALREHGLPTLCSITAPVSNRIDLPFPEEEDLFSLFDPEDRLVRLFEKPPRFPCESQLPMIADRFIRDLEMST